MAEVATNFNVNLDRYKASGVYLAEIDRSAEQQQTASPTTRVVIGFSRKGPVMTPVYLERKETARDVFGEIDESLERKGSFFHRTIDTCLNEGPVFAINMIPFVNEVDDLGNPTADADVAPYRSFSTDVTGDNGRGEWDTPTPSPDVFPFNHPRFSGYNLRLYTSYYNKERFWFPSVDNLLATRVDEDKVTNLNGRVIGGKILNFVNLGKTPITVFVRKAPSNKTDGFRLTAREWYEDNEDIPPFVKESDYISDYFLEVILVKGNFGKSSYEDLSNDQFLNPYFTENGIIADKFDELLDSNLIPVISRFVGTIIPNFRDKQDIDWFIEDIINRQFARTGLFCAVDTNELDRYETGQNDYYVDFVGHRLLDTSNFTENNPDWNGNIDFLSYRTPFKENLKYEQVSLPINMANPNSIFAGDANFTSDSVSELSNDDLISNNVIEFLENQNSDSRFSFYIYDTIDQATGSYYANSLFDKLSNLTPNDSYIVLDIVLDDNNVNTPPVTTKLYTQVKKLLQQNVGNQTAIKVEVENLTDVSGSTNMEPYTNISLESGAFTHLVFERDGFNAGIGSSPTFLYANKNSKLYQDWKNGVIADGDKVFHDIGSTNDTYFDEFYTIEFEQTKDPNFKDLVLKVNFFNPNGSSFNISNLIFQAGENYVKNSNNPDATSPAALTPNQAGYLNVVSNSGSLNTYVDYQAFPDTSVKNRVLIPDIPAWRDDARPGNFIRAKDRNDNPILARITRVRGGYEYNGMKWLNVESVARIEPFEVFGTPETTPQGYTIKGTVEIWRPIENSIKYIDGTYLNGLQLNDNHIPKPNESYVREFYKLLEDTNLKEALSDKNQITWRYVVDTFNQGLDEMSGGKQYLTRLAKSRWKALAFVNAPSIQEFIDSTDPIFTELPTPRSPRPTLKTEYIATGGNLDQNPNRIYSLPDFDNGASHSGFFIPNIIIRDGNKTVSVPPAAYISNLYVRKFKNGNPFQAIGGNRKGRITGANISGLEYDFTKSDRANIEPFGLNPMVKRPDGSIVVMGERTAYQRVNSQLNGLHVRDVLISIEIQIENILETYLFEPNDDATRNAIENEISSYLETVFVNDGIRQNYEVKMDSSNNGPDVISENFGIVDVKVEPVGAIYKYLNRVSILPSGGLNSSGFQPA
jgi:hypothetical protein